MHLASISFNFSFNSLHHNIILYQHFIQFHLQITSLLPIKSFYPSFYQPSNHSITHAINHQIKRALDRALKRSHGRWGVPIKCFANCVIFGQMFCSFVKMFWKMSEKQSILAIFAHFLYVFGVFLGVFCIYGGEGEGF